MPSTGRARTGQCGFDQECGRRCPKHGEAVGGGFGVTSFVALACAVVAGFLYGCGQMMAKEAASAPVGKAVPAE